MSPLDAVAPLLWLFHVDAAVAAITEDDTDLSAAADPDAELFLVLRDAENFSRLSAVEVAVPFVSLSVFRGSVVAVRRYCTAASTVVISPGSLRPLLGRVAVPVFPPPTVVVGRLFRLDELVLGTLKKKILYILIILVCIFSFNR